LIEISQSESRRIDDTGDWTPVRNAYQPRAERGGIWWLVGKHHSGRAGVETYDTASKNLEVGDVWEDPITGLIKWCPSEEAGISVARLSDVAVMRAGDTIIAVEWK